MAKKSANLLQAMRKEADPVQAAAVPSEETPTAAQAANGRTRHYRPGREGKTAVTGFFPAAVKKQLRLMAAEDDTTIQALLAEALNDFFAKKGRPEIAPVEEKGPSG